MVEKTYKGTMTPLYDGQRNDPLHRSTILSALRIQDIAVCEDRLSLVSGIFTRLSFLW